MAMPKVSYEYQIFLSNMDARDWENFNKIRVKHILTFYGKPCLVRFVKSPGYTILHYSCNGKVNQDLVKDFVAERLKQYRLSKLIRGHR